MSSRYLPLWAAIPLVFDLCHASGAFTNITSAASVTSSMKSSSTVTSIPSTITSPASLPDGGQSTTELFPITPGSPYWGNQTIPVNTCTSWNLNGNVPQLVWDPCYIVAGTVQLFYFPPASGNLTYPSTYFNPTIDVTMTSPSMYMLINTISGSNSCGQVGPTMTNVVISLPPSDVSTIALYTASNEQVNTSPPALLTVTDLIKGCSTVTESKMSTTSGGAVINDHAMDDEYNRCYPALVMPTGQLESLGLPYYRHCGIANGRFGMYDPPGAVPPVSGLFPVTQAVSTSTSMPLSTAQSASPDLPSSTAAASPQSSTAAIQSPASSAAIVEPNPDPSTEVNPPATSVHKQSNPTTEGNPAQPATSAAILPSDPQTTSEGVPDATQSNSSPTGEAKTSQILPEEFTAPIPIATLPGGEIASAIPSASTLILGSQTLTAGAAPITLSSSVLASLGSQGLIIQDASSQVSTYMLPTSSAADPMPIATFGTQAISAVEGASSLVIGSQTISIGGPAITLFDNAVATFGSSGLIVSSPNAAMASTYALPSQSSEPFVTIGAYIVSASTGASSIIIGTQTVSLGGAAITLSNSAIATFGASGLVISTPNGIASTYTLPSNKASSAFTPGITPVPIAGSGRNAVVVDGQTLSRGGPVITVSGNDVLTFGSNGVIVMGESGKVATVSVSVSQTNSGGVKAASTADGNGSASASTGTVHFHSGAESVVISGLMKVMIGMMWMMPFMNLVQI